MRAAAGPRWTAPLRWAREHPGLVLFCLAVGAYYLWTIVSSDVSLAFGRNRTDYYNQLTDGFLDGHLHLRMVPDPRLLALPNPYDPVANAPFRNLQGSHDLSLYHGHFFLYWGPIPALLAFLPFRVLPFGDLPEGLALFVFAFTGFCFSIALLRVLARRIAPQAPRWMLAATAVALAAGNALPFTLRRTAVYEVAIAAGFCLAFIALYLLATGLRDGVRPRRLALASLLLGLAVGARPTMLVPALGLVVVAVWLGRQTADPAARRRYAIALLGPVAVIGVALAAYNAVRFGSPLEFGQKYQLAGYDPATKQGNRVSYIPPGLWYYLLSRPHLTLGFPYVHLGPPPLSYPLTAPKAYDSVEAVGGLLFLVPFTLFALAAPFVLRDGARRWTLALVAAAAGILLMASFAIWGATMRYEVDFASLLILAAALAWMAWAVALHGRRRRAVAWGGAVLVAWSALCGSAIGLSGYYNGLRSSEPGVYSFLQHATSPLPTAIARLHGDRPSIVDVFAPKGIEGDGDDGPGLKVLAFPVARAAVELTVISGSPQRAWLNLAAVPTTVQPVAGTRIHLATPDTGRAVDLPAQFPARVVPIALRRGLNRIRISTSGPRGAQSRVADVRLTAAPAAAPTP